MDSFQCLPNEQQESQSVSTAEQRLWQCPAFHCPLHTFHSLLLGAVPYGLVLGHKTCMGRGHFNPFHTAGNVKTDQVLCSKGQQGAIRSQKRYGQSPSTLPISSLKQRVSPRVLIGKKRNPFLSPSFHMFFIMCLGKLTSLNLLLSGWLPG